MDHLPVDGGLQPAAGCRSGVASHYAVPGHLPLDRKGERGGGGLEIIIKTSENRDLDSVEIRKPKESKIITWALFTVPKANNNYRLVNYNIRRRT